MSSDIEMLSEAPRRSASHRSTPVYSLPPSRQPSIPDDRSFIEPAPRDPTPVAPPPASAPAAFLHPPESSKPVSKAKAKQRARSPSGSPPPPERPPLQTIRLDITLGGPDNYEVDIAALARETGQRPPTPVAVKVHHDSGDSEGEEGDVEPDEGGKAPKRKKRKYGADYYDVSDPFIDDSELAIDERKFFAQTKQQGFYVSSGEVALMKDKSPARKPKSRKMPLTVGNVVASDAGRSHGSAINSALRAIQDGSRDAPIPVSDTDEQDRKHAAAAADNESAVTGQKRKRYITVVENGKKRKLVDINSFHPDIQRMVESLKSAIAHENWEVKGKFPPSIKPMLTDLALLAIRLDEYDDAFFALMPQLFPYNKFTMTKLIKRTVFHDHIALLTERQDALLAQLKQLADEGFPKAEEDYKKSLAAWNNRQEKAAAENGARSEDDSNHSAVPTRHPTEERELQDAMDVDGDAPPATQPEKDKGPANPPTKKFRMNEQMKTIVWQLVLLSNEVCRLENEKNQLEGSVIQMSEQGMRKVLYQKIIAAFPDGWVSSGQISRDVSAIKKRLEREQAEDQQ
ncbi:hypothetical protein K525DRAFT_261582 [Schizophyllum commune Loenen D]|nr:hypothetical protein K525DRAFT_261582 [Schizophyllum commune Loenen D]